MKIKMLKTEKGSPDGFTVKVYKAGSEVHLPNDLSAAFIAIGSAEAVVEKMTEPVAIETPEKPKRRRGRKAKA